MPRTRTLVVDRDAPAPEAIAQAVAVLVAGGLVAFATETVYGLGADATRPDAVARIFAAKGRPSTNPLIVHVADLDMARRYAGRWSATANRLGAAVWPGPATLVVPKAASIPASVTAGLDTVGLRVPATAVARALIRALGRPLAAPSANRSEHVSPTRAEHVLADLDGKIDLVLDSGPCAVGIESTVIDLCGQTPRVLRPGPLGAERLAQLLGAVVEDGGGTEGQARSPGRHARHYAPGVAALRVERRAELTGLALQAEDALLVVGAPLDRAWPPTTSVHLPDPEAAARGLYDALRRLDDARPRRIVVVMPPATSAWAAIRDRLVRATTAAPAHNQTQV